MGFLLYKQLVELKDGAVAFSKLLFLVKGAWKESSVNITEVI